MRISIVTPESPGSLKGNAVTAERWAGILRDLDCDVTIEREYRGEDSELLVALHARRSFPSIERFARERADRPLVVALTGTDLYGDIRTDASARRSLELAWRLVVLQPRGVEELSPHLRDKARVIYQSVAARPGSSPPPADAFDVAVLAHLREVKDPLRAAEAARRLPASSRIRVVHAGGASDDDLRRRAQEETASNPRYRWIGRVPREEALDLLAKSRLLVVSSLLEGGANVVSEAIAAGVPVISTRIPGSIGILGEDYGGYFPVGDTEALAGLLGRAEGDPSFYRSLETRCRELEPLIDPARERQSWADLLSELKITHERSI